MSAAGSYDDTGVQHASADPALPYPDPALPVATRATGTHTVFVTFTTNGSGDLVNLNWCQFVQQHSAAWLRPARGHATGYR